jgi:hypothetical protein
MLAWALLIIAYALSTWSLKRHSRFAPQAVRPPRRAQWTPLALQQNGALNSIGGRNS